MKIRFIAFFAAMMVALAAPKRAAADPITAIVTAISGFAASSAIAGFVVKLGLSLALTALSTVLAKKPKGQQTQGGIKTDSTTNGGTNAQTFIMGRYATAGNMVAPPYSFPNDGDPPNNQLVYVIDIADMPGVTLERVMVAGEYVALKQLTSNSWRAYNREGYYRMYAHWNNGHQAAADAYMMANFANHPSRPWQADMVGRGVTYAVLTFVYTPELWNQLPGVRFQVMGIPLYDPRQDSSAGGSGAHRWDNPGTWTQTENPMVMIYNILRGITLPDGKIWGGRVQPEDLPLAPWFAAMNECDVPVALAAGGTEPQYRAGIEVSVDESPADVIEELLAACSGEIAEFGGVYKPRVGPPALPVYFFTDSDIIADRPEKLTPYPGLDAVHNAIHATYPEPAALWERSDAPPRYNAGWEAADAGRQLVAKVELPAVPYVTQVQRLMKAWIEDERRFRRHSLTLPPDAAILEPLDTVSWTSADHGYSGKVFEVGEITDEFETCLQTMAVRERDAGDFAWVPGVDEVAVVHPDPARLEPAPRTLPGFNLVRFDLQDTASTPRRPGLKLIWSAANLLDNDRIEYRLQLPNGTAVASGSVTDAHAGEVVISAGLIPGTEYRASARIVTDGAATWTAWAHATTGAVLMEKEDIAAAAVDWDRLGDDVKQSIQSTRAIRDGNSVSGNAVFSLWPAGGAPDGYSVAANGQGTVTQDTAAGLKYGQAALIDTIATPTGDGPELVMQAEQGSIHYSRPADQVFQIIVEAELELLHSDWGSARILARWKANGDGTSADVVIDLAATLTTDQDVIQHVSEFIDRPAGYVPSSDAEDEVQLVVMGTSAAAGPAYCRFRVHSLDYRLLDRSAEAKLYQKAVAVDDIQAAAIGLRVVSGTETQEVAELELVSLSDPNGIATSSARVKADNILLQGSVRAPYIQVDEFLDIDAQHAGFRMSKTGIHDYVNDGVYMGTHVDEAGDTTFGMFMGRTTAGKEEYFRLTKDEGLQIKNAQYLIGSSSRTQVNITGTQWHSLAGFDLFSFDAVGGGGGGGAGWNAHDGGGGAPGSNGQPTLVQLYDGATLIWTWTAPGGVGGSGKENYPYKRYSTISPYGDSGVGGDRGVYIFSQGSNDNPTTKILYGHYGVGGYAGQYITAGNVDISGYADPKLYVQCGQGGLGGAAGSNPPPPATGNGGRAGGNGVEGIVRLQKSVITEVPAGPVAVAPTAVGTFSSGVGPDIYTLFPDISPGRGFWQITAFYADIDIDPVGSHYMNITNNTGPSVSFFSHGRPVVRSSTANVTMYYTFRAM